MNPGLLFPAGLLALAGLLVPLLIHLVRRSELVVHDFAALRWLSARARPRRRLRFDDRALLAVRLVLIAVIAVLLAQPILTRWPGARDWLLVVPGAKPSAVPVPDDARPLERPIERRWLAPGLPALDSPMPAAGPSASLLRELDSRLAPESTLTVEVPSELGGLDGERPRLSRPVEWRVSSADSTPVEPASLPATAARPGLWLVYAPERAEELRFLRAAADAGGVIDSDTPESTTTGPVLDILGEIALPSNLNRVDWPTFGAGRLIWLSEQALPPAVVGWIQAGGQVLRVGVVDGAANDDSVLVWRSADPGSDVRAYTLGSGRLMVLAARLDPEYLPELLQPDFPDILRGWLQSPGPEPSRAPARSHAPDTGLAAWPPPSRGLGDWLAALIALLFLLERWLASAPGRLR